MSMELVSRLPLNMFAVCIMVVGLMPSQYFLWGIGLIAAIAFGLLIRNRPSLKQVASKPLRSVSTFIVMAVPCLMAPVHFYGPYLLGGYMIEQGTAFVLGFIVMSLSVLEYILGEK